MTKNLNSIVCFYFTYSELHKTFFSKTQLANKLSERVEMKIWQFLSLEHDKQLNLFSPSFYPLSLSLFDVVSKTIFIENGDGMYKSDCNNYCKIN
jgi:hypothetical protein